MNLKCRHCSEIFLLAVDTSSGPLPAMVDCPTCKQLVWVPEDRTMLSVTTTRTTNIISKTT